MSSITAKYFASLFDESCEVAAKDYKRAPMFFKANGEAVGIFEYPQNDWGTVDCFGVYDAEVGGKLVAFGQLPCAWVLNPPTRQPVLYLPAGFLTP